MEAPRRRPFPGRATIVLTVLSALVLGWLGATVWHASGIGALGRYPELAWIPAPPAHELPAAFGDPFARGLRARTADASWYRDRLRRHGGLPFVRAWIDRDSRLERTTWRLGLSKDDETNSPDAWALRDAAAGAPTEAVLLRMARDRDLHVETRVRTFVALARPGHPAALETLAAVVLDEREVERIREEALIRLPRFEASLPGRLRELLDVPFDGLDGRAAVILAAAGEMECPTLVLRQLRETLRDRGGSHWTTSPDASLAIEGIRRVAGGDAAMSAALDDAVRVLGRAQEFQRPWRDVPSPDPLAPLADAFEAWLAAHPESRATEWERRYERQTARAAEIAARFRDPEDVIACPVATLDLAAAGHVGNYGDNEHATAELIALERVADWLRPQLARCGTPREKLQRMQDALVGHRRGVPATENESSIWIALRFRAGNCMAWTRVFVALGDRLGLPLRGVSVPGHVYVRWDDGTTRLNWDPSHEGASWSDDEIVRRFGGDGRTGGRAPYPLTRRELTSAALTNDAAYWLQNADAYGFGLRAADVAVRLDPASVLAHVNHAATLSYAATRSADELLAAAAAAESAPGFRPEHAHLLARTLSAAARGEQALALLDRHPGDDSDSPNWKAARVRALCSLGRHAEASPIATALASELPTDRGVAALAVAASFGVTADDGWRALETALRRLANGERERFQPPPGALLVLDVAERLLDDAPRTEDRAQLANLVLDVVGPRTWSRKADTKTLRDLVGLGDTRWTGIDNRRDDLRARAWDRLGKPDEAARLRDEKKLRRSR